MVEGAVRRAPSNERGTLQNWEQGRQSLRGPARVLLNVQPGIRGGAGRGRQNGKTHDRSRRARPVDCRSSEKPPTRVVAGE